MKYYWMFVFIVISILACDSPFQSENNEKFALFLLRDGQMTTTDALTHDLNSLQLSESPIISYDDLVVYDLKEHKIFLKRKFYDYITNDTAAIFSLLEGKPFVVVANGKKIYLGSFVPGISSYAPDSPCIADYSIDSLEKSLVISRGPVFDESNFIDVRNDKRILQALIKKLK